MKTTSRTILLAGLAALVLAGCKSQSTPSTTMSGLDPAAFDSIIGGKKVELVTLRNSRGMEVCITNYGGRVVSLTVPDRDQKPTDVVLGYDNLRQYADTAASPSDYGSTVGRYANRIKDARLTVDGKEYVLRANDNGNCLHGGGNTGWLNKIYDIESRTDSSVVLTITSPDGDNGFPGTVKARATYTVKDDNTLDCFFEAETDKETVVNMTNHSYFNLSGDPSQVGTDQIMYINADRFTPADAKYIPTGEIRDVTGTPMDFRKEHAIGETIADTTYDQIRNATGYDHNWCLNTYHDGGGDDRTVAASLYSPKTGILLEVFTNEPGMQVYTGNFQGTGISCKHGVKYPKHVSVCFESQKYPDSPTKIAARTKGWEVSNPYLKPGEKYRSHLAYRFSIAEK